MKKNIYILTLGFLLGISACQKSDFVEAYGDPSKIANSTVEKQFAGLIYTSRDYVVPSYWNYFVINRITLNRYVQATGWVNAENQYTPGSSSVGYRWTDFYKILAQYREIQKIHSSLSEAEKKDRRIYLIAATTYLYDHAHKVIDLHGDIPLLDAGMLSTNGGNYLSSYAKYDTAESLYTKMLDDLKGYSDELNTIVVSSGIMTGFQTQDIILNGNITGWKRYVNSLRLRLLTRVSNAPTFTARAKTEIAQILGDATKYPVITQYDENVMIKVYDLSSPINAKGFETGLEDWDGNIAGKQIIDNMVSNKDPRLNYIFEVGEKANGVHAGIDPLGLPNDQGSLITNGVVSKYNRSTFSKNQYFPGVLVTATEVDLNKAEYYLLNGNDAMGKTSYENAVKSSLDFYQKVRALSNNNITPVKTVPTASDINSYLNGNNISWSKATTNDQKLALIANQRWIHFNVVQPTENWAELRRTDLPKLQFWTDNAGTQKTVPNRWQYPGNEITYNTAMYNAIKAKDNLATKIFWDVK